jgi:hypothetical protein
MTTTTNFQIPQLEVGQTSKEATINAALVQIDTIVPRYLGDLASDPATTGVAKGSTYYNTATSKLKVLRANMTWANAA